MATTASIFSTPPKGKKALNKMDSGFDVDEPHPLLRSAKEMIIAGFHTSAELMVGVLFINLRCWITERLIETLYSSSS